MSDHQYLISDLARLVRGQLRGEGSAKITGLADINEAQRHHAAWASRGCFEAAVKTSKAGVVLVPTGFGESPMPVILCENIQESVALLLGAFASPSSLADAGVHPSAFVDNTATLGEHVTIGPCAVISAGARIGARCMIHAGAFVGRDSVLGDDCEIHPNAVIHDRCRIGSHVIIHSCAVIGGDGFGYYFNGGSHKRFPHVGGVIIEDDVEIGACSCVDRAKFGNTVVGRGTKIDNQVQVAHNCRLGRHNVLAGQVGLCGSVRTGDYCVLGGRVVAFDNLTIGHKVQLAAMSVVTKELPDGLKAGGFPAQALQTEMREKATMRRLPALCDKIKDLLERVERLEAAAQHTP
jgi:UDP-3-O-[3-hydroxymyristoyl] glucosamine N-acyltransferase